MSATRHNGAATRGEPEIEIHPVNEFPGERVYTDVYPGVETMQDSIVQYPAGANHRGDALLLGYFLWDEQQEVTRHQAETM